MKNCIVGILLTCPNRIKVSHKVSQDIKTGPKATNESETTFYNSEVEKYTVQ